MAANLRICVIYKEKGNNNMMKHKGNKNKKSAPWAPYSWEMLKKIIAKYFHVVYEASYVVLLPS